MAASCDGIKRCTCSTVMQDLNDAQLWAMQVHFAQVSYTLACGH